MRRGRGVWHLGSPNPLRRTCGLPRGSAEPVLGKDLGPDVWRNRAGDASAEARCQPQSRLRPHRTATEEAVWVASAALAWTSEFKFYDQLVKLNARRGRDLHDSTRHERDMEERQNGPSDRSLLGRRTFERIREYAARDKNPLNTDARKASAKNSLHGDKMRANGKHIVENADPIWCGIGFAFIDFILAQKVLNSGPVERLVCSWQGVSLHHQLTHVQEEGRRSNLATDFDHSIIVSGVALCFRRWYWHKRGARKPFRIDCRGESTRGDANMALLVHVAGRTRLFFQVRDQAVRRAKRVVFPGRILVQVQAIIVRRETSMIRATLFVDFAKARSVSQVPSRYRRARVLGLRPAPQNARAT
jgi:hypothetical protein